MEIFKNKLLMSSSVYVIANLFSAVVPFILLPYLTNNVDTKGYGTIALISIAVNFVGPFVGLCVDGALLRRFYNGNEFKYDLYLSNCLYIVLSSYFILSILSYFFGEHIGQLFLIPSYTIKYIFFISFSNIINQFTLTTWRVNEKPVYYGLFQIILSLTNLCFTFYFISGLHHSWEGRMEAWALANGVFSVFSITFLFKKKLIFKSITSKYIKDALKFSIPLIPHAIGAMLLGFFSRLIVGNVLNIEQVGIFSVSYQFASILGITFAAFNTAFVPWLFGKLKSNNPDHVLLVRSSYKLILIFIVVTLISCLAIYTLFPFMVSENYFESKIYIFYLLIAFMFNGMYYLFANYIFYKEKTKYLGYSTGIISIAHLPICYFLTQKYGLTGAAVSNIISYFFLLTITALISFKVYPMPWASEIKNTFNFKAK